MSVQRDELRASLRAEAVRRGFTVGRDALALKALREVLLSGGTASAQEALSCSLPRPHLQWRCPACWTHLSGEMELAFVACPNCGHGMFQKEVREPFRCTLCHYLTDGYPKRTAHRTTNVEGEEGAPCPGELRPAPYLSFDLAHRAAKEGPEIFLILLGNPPQTPKEQLAALPIHTPGQSALRVLVRAPGKDTGRLEALRQALARCPGAALLEDIV